jgi:hypothetical protein
MILPLTVVNGVLDLSCFILIYDLSIYTLSP